MDFIPFNTPGKETTQQSGKKTQHKSVQKKPAFGSPALAFGSPAVGFGAPAAVNSTPKQGYGTPAVNSTSKQGYGTPAQGFSTPAQGCGSPSIGFNNPTRPSTSPISKNSYSPSPSHAQRASSPRHTQFTPRGSYNQSPSPRVQYQSQSPRHQISYNSFTPSPLAGRNNSFDGSNFKAPQQFSPGRGRGNVRKSFSAGYYSQNDPNQMFGGGINVENYYNEGMVQDPWKFLKPIVANR